MSKVTYEETMEAYNSLNLDGLKGGDVLLDFIHQYRLPTLDEVIEAFEIAIPEHKTKVKETKAITGSFIDVEVYGIWGSEIWYNVITIANDGSYKTSLSKHSALVAHAITLGAQYLQSQKEKAQ